LTNFGCHPEVLWDENTKISPDYPVAIHRIIEKSFGGVSVFISGALGAMVTPGLSEDAPLSDRESFYTSFGMKLGKIARETAMRAKVSNHVKLEAKTSEVLIPLKNFRLLFAAGLGLLDRDMNREGVTTEIGHLRIGPAHIAMVPGEPAPALGIQFKRYMKGKPNFLFALANDEIGYILESTDYGSKNYEYESTVSLGAPTAQMLIDAYRDLVK